MTKLRTIDDLRPADYNPREMTETGRSGLRWSLDEFGDISGITWNQRTGNLVCGHQRVHELKARGASLRIDGARAELVTESGEVFAVRVVDWEEPKEKAANLAANNPHIQGRFTEGADPLLRELRQTLPESFWNDGGFAALLEDVRIPGFTPDAQQGANETPEPPTEGSEWVKDGDLFVCGKHRVLCGESDVMANRQRLLDGAEVDVVFTDPPYGIEYRCRSDAKNRMVQGLRIPNDGAVDTDQTKAALRQLVAMAVPDAKFRYICCRWSSLAIFMESLGKPKTVIVWDKGSVGFGRGYRPQHEWIMFFGVLNRADLSNVWKVARDPRGEYRHPTQKPVELALRALTDCGARRVYDPFGGSGSTLIAAEQLGVQCFTMEKTPRWTQVIVERWQEFTGKKADVRPSANEMLQADS